MKSTIYAVLVLLTICTPALSQDLAFSIHANSQSARVGESIVFTFTYKNTSDHDVGIYPAYYAYEALDTYFAKASAKQKGKLIQFLSPAHFDCEVVAKTFRILRSGESYSRKRKCTVATSLPPDIIPSEKRAPLYILFADSAIALPQFGKYNVLSCYVGLKSYADCLDVAKRDLVWVGKVCTAPIDLDIQK